MSSQLLRIATLGTFLCVGFAMFPASAATSQEVKPPTPDDQVQAKIDHLVDRLGKELEQKHVTKVIVFDLLGPKGLRAPFGSWLADEICSRLAKQHPSLQVIDRAAVRPLLDQRNKETEQAHQTVEGAAAYTADAALSKQAGAETWVSGSYSKLAKGVGITLSASDVATLQTISTVTALLPPTPQVIALLPSGLEVYVPKDGVYDAGIGGIGTPTCLKCPDPSYDVEARRAKCGGTALLRVAVANEGSVSDVVVLREIPGCPSLTRAAKETVSRWQLRPAPGPDGEPVATRVQVEVAFRIITDKDVGGPACIKCAAPKMDRGSRKNHCHGIVGVEFSIAPDGRATDVSVTREVDGCPGLTKALLVALSKSRFRTGLSFEGRPLPARRRLEVEFKNRK